MPPKYWECLACDSVGLLPLPARTVLDEHGNIARMIPLCPNCGKADIRTLDRPEQSITANVQWNLLTYDTEQT